MGIKYLFLSIGSIKLKFKAKDKCYLVDHASYFEYIQSINFNGLIIKPKLSLEVFNQYHQAYTEHGAGSLNLSFKKKLFNAAKVTPSIEFSKVIKKENAILMPNLGVSYSYTRDIGSSKHTGSLIGQPSSFALGQAYHSSNVYGLNLGLVANIKATLRLAYNIRANLKRKLMITNSLLGLSGIFDYINQPLTIIKMVSQIGS